MKIFTRTDAATTKKTLAIFREEINHEKRSFWLGMILIPLSNLFSMVILPLLVSFIIQDLIEGKPWHDMTWLFVGMIVASIASIIANQIGFDEFFNHEERIVTRLVDRAMQALMSHSQLFFSNQKVGSLANDVNTFSRSYLTFMDNVAMNFMGIAVSYVASLIVIAFIAPLLLVPLFLLTAFVVWHSLRSMSERSIYRNKRKELQSQLVGQIADILGNQTLVRLFGKRQQEIARVIAKRNAITDIAAKEIDLIQKNAKTRQSVLFSFQIITIGLIVVLIQNKLIAVGAAIFAITYLGRVTSTMFNITSIIRGFEQSLLDAAKIIELLNETPDVTDAPNAEIMKVSHGSISFSSVGFSYADAPNEHLFQGLNLTIAARSSVGLVGKSGGGKTTMTNLLLRYADVTSGSVRIDDQDVSHVQQDSLRNVISYVPQDPYLFHRSLKSNIAYGKDGASDAEIVDAAKKAHAWEFIEKLPQGLDTIVGERGVKLSGGQRQRIAIARAILKDAPILVLDEATSALDSESEKLIQASLETLMKNRTSIVIAHRLSTIAKLDRIIVLDDGKIVEDGSHQELLARNGVYAKLWNHQSGGFIEE